jgi:hypothetical protein
VTRRDESDHPLRNQRFSSPLTAEDRVKIFGDEAFWPFSVDEFLSITKTLPNPSNADCVERILDISRRFVVHRRNKEIVGASPRDQIRQIGNCVAALLDALRTASSETQMSFHMQALGKNMLPEFLENAEKFWRAHLDLFMCANKTSVGGRPRSPEEVISLIKDARAVFRLVHIKGRRPQKFWAFFHQLTIPLERFGLSKELAGAHGDEATWQDAWEAIERRNRGNSL